MATNMTSSDLTETTAEPVGPPLVGALLRMPLDVVMARMLEGLHADGFGDLNAAHLSVLRWPARTAAAPRTWPARRA